jgi:Holliday junction resolvasome RuvABC endonuclease subunit
MATKTGWCLCKNNGQIVESGMQDFVKKRGESNGLLFLRFRKWLVDLAKTLPAGETNLIAYEQARFRGGAATELCVGLQTRAQEIAAELDIESAPVTTNTLKKFATGKGRTAGKQPMIDAAKPFLGRDPIDDNEADAVHIARWAANEFFPE